MLMDTATCKPQLHVVLCRTKLYRTKLTAYSFTGQNLTHGRPSANSLNLINILSKCHKAVEVDAESRRQCPLLYCRVCIRGPNTLMLCFISVSCTGFLVLSDQPCRIVQSRNMMWSSVSRERLFPLPWQS